MDTFLTQATIFLEPIENFDLLMNVGTMPVIFKKLLQQEWQKFHLEELLESNWQI